MKHTPEPWTTHNPVNPKNREASLDVGIAAQVGGTPKVVAEAFGQVAQPVFTLAAANAKRIVACVNACEGIPGLQVSGRVVGVALAVAPAGGSALPQHFPAVRLKRQFLMKFCMMSGCSNPGNFGIKASSIRRCGRAHPP